MRLKTHLRLKIIHFAKISTLPQNSTCRLVEHYRQIENRTHDYCKISDNVCRLFVEFRRQMQPSEKGGLLDLFDKTKPTCLHRFETCKTAPPLANLNFTEQSLTTPPALPNLLFIFHLIHGKQPTAEIEHHPCFAVIACGTPLLIEFYSAL